MQRDREGIVPSCETLAHLIYVYKIQCNALLIPDMSRCVTRLVCCYAVAVKWTETIQHKHYIACTYIHKYVRMHTNVNEPTVSDATYVCVYLYVRVCTIHLLLAPPLHRQPAQHVIQPSTYQSLLQFVHSLFRRRQLAG